MPDLNNQLPASQLTTLGEEELIKYLEQALLSGKHWYIALLEAVGLWTKAEETYDGRIYRYLVAGEALDWMLLAERLCETVDGLLPEDEKADLLFCGKPPINLTADKFKELIGSDKHRMYLNYFYGVAVEEALTLAVQEEVRKERRTSGFSREGDSVNDEAYRRVYGASKAVLLRRFRREKSLPQSRSIGLPELKEFTYWLFKYRLKQCDRARIASDTKKGLKQLRQLWAIKGFPADPAIDDTPV